MQPNTTPNQLDEKQSSQHCDAEDKAAKAKQKLADQLALFESLPACALVALPIVCLVKGRSPASIWRDVAAGRIDKPVKAGPRSSRWRVGGLRAR